MPLEKDKQMLRILYAVYFELIAIPVFVVHTILTALIVTVDCLLGGEKFFSFYPGILWEVLNVWGSGTARSGVPRFGGAFCLRPAPAGAGVGPRSAARCGGDGPAALDTQST